MSIEKIINLSDSTLQKAGLMLSDKCINAESCHDARVFEFKEIPGVYIMENDLYGKEMQKDNCFLAYYGHHGWMGQDITADDLVNFTVADIKAMVALNIEG